MWLGAMPLSTMEKCLVADNNNNNNNNTKNNNDMLMVK
jgi:hypothetical protein